MASAQHVRPYLDARQSMTESETADVAADATGLGRADGAIGGRPPSDRRASGGTLYGARREGDADSIAIDGLALCAYRSRLRRFPRLGASPPVDSQGASRGDLSSAASSCDSGVDLRMAYQEAAETHPEDVRNSLEIRKAVLRRGGGVSWPRSLIRCRSALRPGPASPA